MRVKMEIIAEIPVEHRDDLRHFRLEIVREAAYRELHNLFPNPIPHFPIGADIREDTAPVHVMLASKDGDFDDRIDDYGSEADAVEALRGLVALWVEELREHIAGLDAPEDAMHEWYADWDTPTPDNGGKPFKERLEEAKTLADLGIVLDYRNEGAEVCEDGEFWYITLDWRVQGAYR